MIFVEMVQIIEGGESWRMVADGNREGAQTGCRGVGEVVSAFR
ncbi:hypothetical protein [Streptomyces albogriseolus]